MLHSSVAEWQWLKKVCVRYMLHSGRVAVAEKSLCEIYVTQLSGRVAVAEKSLCEIYVTQLSGRVAVAEKSLCDICYTAQWQSGSG